MGDNRNKQSKWRVEQGRAEILRQQARAHLKRKGLTAHNEKPIQFNLPRRDNTLELVEKRRKRLHQQEVLIEEPLPIALSKKSETPSAAATAVPEAGSDSEVLLNLPYGWVIAEGQGLETSIFVHSASGCTTIKLPKRPVMDLAQRKNIQLPFGWKALKDNESNRIYYWNTRSGKVQWRLPGIKREQ